MAASSSKQHAIVKMAKRLLQLPQDNSDVVCDLADEVNSARKQSMHALAGIRQRLKGREAAQVSTCVVAALHCAGWMAQAAKRIELRDGKLDYDDIRRIGIVHAAAGMCSEAAVVWIKRLDLSQGGLDLLRAVTRPAAGGNEPGVTTWLPWAAGFDWLMLRAAEDTVDPRSCTISSTLELWSLLMGMAQNYSSSMTVHPAAWLARQLLQLADKVLLGVRQPDKVYHGMLVAAIQTAASKLMWHTHPQLGPWVTGSPADAALSARAAAALHQDIWWHALATCTLALGSLAALTTSSMQHPCMKQLAAYTSQGYSLQLLDNYVPIQVDTLSSCVLRVLLLAELWAVWPWQLQQLQAAAAAASSSSSGGSSSGCDGDGTGGKSSTNTGGGVGSGNAGSNSDSSSSTSAPGGSSNSSGNGGASSSTGSSGAANLSIHAQSLREGLAGGVHLEFPMLSKARTVAEKVEPSHPVTLQQLQLATCAMYLCPTGIYSTGLLLALLLHRADPGLQAEFLSSPMGNFMVYIMWRGPHMEQVGGPPFGWHISRGVYSPPVALAQFKAALADPAGELAAAGLVVLPAATCSLLMLAWAHLEVRPGGVPGQQPGSQQDIYRAVLLTPTYVTSKDQGSGECMVVEALPCTAYRFLPGLAPSLDLFAMVEQLLREQMTGRPPIHGLCSVAALVHAAVEMWVAGSQPVCASTTSSTPGSSSSSSDSPDGNTDSSGNNTETSSSSSDTANHVSSSRSNNNDNSNTGSSNDNDNVCGDSQSSSSSNEDSTASTSSGTAMSPAEEVCGPGTLQVLASLAVSAAVTLQCLKQSDSSDASTELVWVLQPCSLIAADLLHLVTYQLQQPGADRAAVMQLAAAAQRLTAACVDSVGCGVGVLLREHTAGATSSAVVGGVSSATILSDQQQSQQQQQQQSQQQQQQQQQAGIQQSTPDGSAPKSAFNSTELQLCIHSAAMCMHALMGLQLQLQHVMASRLGAVDPALEDLVAAAARYLAPGSKDPDTADGKHMMRAIKRCPPRLQLVGCNHQGCTNLSGPSAEGLVAGRKGVRCGACGVARYCSPACQKEDWPQHQRMCRRLAAAAGQGQLEMWLGS